MVEENTCPKCQRELKGAIETVTTNDGTYVFLVQLETTDCNWVKCSGCKQISCKECRESRYRFCCYEGRITDQQRAQTEFARGNAKHK